VTATARTRNLMDYSEIAKARGIPIVSVSQENSSRWHWTLYNTVGGSFGMSDSGSSRKRAIAHGAHSLSDGVCFLVAQNHWNGEDWETVGVLDLYQKSHGMCLQGVA